VVDSRPDIEEALSSSGPVSFSPKMVYLGMAMVILLVANAFLATQKNKLQADVDRRDEQILRLKTELMLLQAPGSPAEPDASVSAP
jgi:hypothetical protein